MATGRGRRRGRAIGFRVYRRETSSISLGLTGPLKGSQTGVPGVTPMQSALLRWKVVG